MQENDQTLPAGLWRIVADGNQWFIRRNTAAAGDFSSEINAFTLNTSTDATFYGNVTAYSDERLKKDWTELPDGIIEDMAALLSGTFTRVDTGQRQVGVGAQSLHRFLPEAVLDGEKLSVAYGNAALAIITKLCQRVVKMDARIAELEAKQ